MIGGEVRGERSERGEGISFLLLTQVITCSFNFCKKIKMIKSKISEIDIYLPEKIICNNTIAKVINQNGSWISEDKIEPLFGIKERRYAAEGEQASDLATKAGLSIVEKVGRENIDFLIFASACSDLIEPATCNIVQNKLGLNCPAMDVKNACNSFVSGLQTASAMIGAGMYKNILIVTGEKLSDSIRTTFLNKEEFRKSAAALSFGDAGSAVLVSATEDEEGIIFQKFKTIGKHWELCTIKGGGSMYPHDVSKNYFSGQTWQLKDVFLKESKGLVEECFAEANCSPEEIDHLFTHQVSSETFKIVSSVTGIPLEKCSNVFKHYGNTAAASIPLSINERLKDKKLKRGDKILILGLAAGVSISFQILTW